MLSDIGSVATILTACVTTIAWLIRMRRQSSSNEKAAETAFQERCRALKSSATNAGGRADLGVLVLMELSEGQHQILRWLHNATGYTVFAGMFLSLMIFARNGCNNRMAVVFASLATAAILFMMFAVHYANCAQQRLTKYRRELKQIWAAAVDKRIDKAGDERGNETTMA